MHKTAIALALLANIGTAFAAEKTGPYIYGNIGGINSLETSAGKTVAGPIEAVTGANLVKGNASTMAFEVGTGFRVNNNFSIEAGYNQSGQFRNEDIGSIKSRALRLSALAIAPIGDSFEVYGKASILGIQDNFKSSTATLSDSKTHKTAFGLGVGAAYHINKSVSIKTEVEYMRSFKQNNPLFEKDDKIGATIGLNYYF